MIIKTIDPAVKDVTISLQNAYFALNKVRGRLLPIDHDGVDRLMTWLPSIQQVTTMANDRIQIGFPMYETLTFEVGCNSIGTALKKFVEMIYEEYGR